MSDVATIDVCRTPDGGTQSNNVSVCLWCECQLKDLIAAGKLKAGASGDPVKKLHEHLKRFGMQTDLGEFKDGKPQDGADVKNGTWGAHTTRALRLFASHPGVGAETESILTVDGKAINEALAGKIRTWCRAKVASPQNYWQFKQVKIKADDLDALGSEKHPEKQTVLHDFIAQVERDLAKIGFAAHSDGLCGLGKNPTPTGVFTKVKPNADKKHVDKDLRDVSYLVEKFQRQATWLWRMKADGKHLADAAPSDSSVYTGSQTGEIDAATAKALHEWATAGLHIVIKKFELTSLNWPPSSATPITDADSGGNARLRADAQEKWLDAAKEVADLGGTLAGPYASSPRSWRSGKKTSPGASPFSWHYSGLAVDLCQAFNFADGTITDKSPYGLEKDGDKFRIWCWASPQPAVPAAPADDSKTPLKQYRNRNVVYKHVKGKPNETKKAGAPTDPSPLYFATKTQSGADVVDVAAREGWYVDVTAIMDKHGFNRIKRHSDWLTNPKAWEFWHYQYEPPLPPGATVAPTFGEYVQLYGVHELRLRQVGWSAHEDIDHAAG